MTVERQIYDLDDEKVVLPPDGEYWVAPGAVVIGKVVLKRNASVWFNAVLRGDTETITIGENSNVQDGVILHTDPGEPLDVGANVTIGHRAMLHGCTIGEGSLIGAGAIVLNGAKIGRGCLVGAGALIPERKVIPDGSLVVGAPGRVARTVSEAEAAFMQAAALRYVSNWKRFREGLRPRPSTSSG
jgi:carbonic anhydrase/acetyltransferase-like protein (isoleucine patch superfamily)